MEFAINPTNGTAIYQQLAEQVRSAIARGQLKPDERLPSVRELSQSLVINPNTVARVYTELESEGVVYTRPGMGVFVAAMPAPLAKKVRRERITRPIDQLLVEAVRLGFELDELLLLIEDRAKPFAWPRAAVRAT